MDKRSRNTIEQIKEAFLSVKRRKSFCDITVTDVCREAHISRGTFYLHFDNMDRVLDAVLGDFFSKTKDVLKQVGIVEEAQFECSKYPLCQFVRENPQFHCIFLDEALTSKIIQKIVDISEDSFVAQMQAKSVLTVEQIRTLLYFQLNGCLAVSRMKVREPNSIWCTTYQMLDKFLHAGYGAFFNEEI